MQNQIKTEMDILEAQIDNFETNVLLIEKRVGLDKEVVDHFNKLCDRYSEIGIDGFINPEEVIF